jgi:citrate lyase subunit beta/citryl-CoA lyase
MSVFPVTYLFVPATEDRKIAKALGSETDAVILDLEDSIAAGMKEAARAHLSEYLRTAPPADTGPQVWVRVNSGDTGFFSADAKAIPWSVVTGAVLPKAEHAHHVHALIEAGAKRVLPIIESAAGFRVLDLLEAAGDVERFAIGTWDLAIDIGILAVEPDESELIWQLRGELVLASRQLDLPPPIDGVHAQFDDDDGLKKSSERAHRMGFGAKLLIHPRQIATVRSVFRPDDQTLRHARDVIRVYEDAVREGRGAVQLNGEMIDRPIVERARALIARWGNA